MTIDKLNNLEEVTRFLRDLHIRVDEWKVRKVVVALEKKSHVYDLHKHGRYRTTGADRKPILGNGTVRKITNLYKEGRLQLYLDYLNQPAIVDKAIAGQSNGTETQTAEEQTEAQQPPKGTDQHNYLKGHLDKIAEAAEELSSRVNDLLLHRSKGETYYRGNLVDGIDFPERPLTHPRNTSIGSALARCVLAHYEDRYDRLPSGTFEQVTMENASQKLADNLVRLAHSTISEPCPICPACQEIAGLPHIGRNWVRRKDGKTGEWQYAEAKPAPEDF